MGTTPVEQAMAWVLDAVARGPDVTRAEVEAAFAPEAWSDRWTLDEGLEHIRQGGRIARPFTIESTTASNPQQGEAVVVGPDGKRVAVTCWVLDQPPHGLTGFRTMPAPPPGTTIRLATPDDAAVLADLERRSPLRLGEDGTDLMFFDRGEDYFASARLMEEVTIYVAEVDGAVAGVYWGAQQPVRIEGAGRKLFLEHHVRIDPDTRRAGVFWALCTYGRDTYARTADSIAFFVSPDNHAVRKFVEGTPSWSVQPLRALLPCSSDGAGDGDAAARSATEDDAARVVEIINGCHNDAELFLPYSAESLSARLGRSPEQYGWADLRVSDGAVVGVGREMVAVAKVRDGERRESVRAQVLDHGVLAGHESSYRDLLLGWCAELGRRGVTDLAVFTSPASPTHGVVTELADEIEPFDFWAFNFGDPPDLAEVGFYVDPVYF